MVHNLKNGKKLGFYAELFITPHFLRFGKVGKFAPQVGLDPTIIAALRCDILAIGFFMLISLYLFLQTRN